MGIGPCPPRPFIPTIRKRGDRSAVQVRHCLRVPQARSHHFGIEWWEDIVDAATFQPTNDWQVQTETMANYLRLLGWEAQASNMNRYLTLMPQIILDAGWAKSPAWASSLIPSWAVTSKRSWRANQHGARDRRLIDFGLQDYCDTCALCAVQCPSPRYPHGPRPCITVLHVEN
jgi:hypothetical protein